MKIRMIALAGVAALALSTPAMAVEGWYLGLGAGYDQQNGIKGTSVPFPTTFSGKSNSSNGPLLAGAFGYSWDGGLRIEDEISWSGHDIKDPTATGYVATTADMI